MDPARKDDTPKKKKRLRQRIFLALLSTVVALGLAEVGLRVVAAIWNRERGVDYHEEYGWKMIPNVEKVGFLWGGDAVTKVNSDGWRDDEFVIEPDSSRQRIVVVGDSFTFGVGVNHGDRFTEQMETHGLEVLNFGVNSTGTDQHLRYLEAEALAYRPSVVVLVTFLGNDLDDIRLERKQTWPKPYYELHAGELKLVPPKATFWINLRTSSYLAEVIFQVIDRYVDRNRVAPPWESADTVPLYVALATRMRDVAMARGAKFLVAVVYPMNNHEIGATRREKAVRIGLRSASVETLDTFDLFKDQRAAGEDAYLPDGHWNPHGHAIFAAALFERLGALGWIAR